MIYIMYPNCMPDIMIPPGILFTRLLYYLYAWYHDPSSYFVHKVALLHKMTKSEKGDNSAKYLENFANS